MRRLTLHIERLSKQGEGVASADGRTVFIPGAFPGEDVVADVEDAEKVWRGQLVSVERKSASRREAPCDLASSCGGCDWLELDERAQLAAKQEIVVSALEHLGSIPRDAYALRTSVPSPRAMGYRRRAVLHVSDDKRLGLFGRRSHDIVPLSRCPAMTAALSSLPSVLAEPLAPISKDIDTVTLLNEGDDAAFSVQLKGLIKPRHEEAVQSAMKKARCEGAVLVPNDGPSRSYGKPALKALSPLHPHIPLYVRPDGFAQANAEGNVALVTSALYELAPTDVDRVIELYSGNGNFSFALAQVSKEVVGIESSPVGIELAQRSARESSVANVRFVQGDAFKVAKGLAGEGQRFDLMLVDPPRTGAQGIADVALSLGVKRIVYVACDPAALARDAGDLRARGFLPKALQLVDMFPQTHHIEAVMSFERVAVARG